MKKLLSIMSILLLAFSGVFLASCGSPYAGIKLDAYVDGIKVESGQTVEYILDSNENNQYPISVRVTNAKEDIGNVSFFTKGTSSAFSVLTDTAKKQGNETTIMIQAKSAGIGELYARLLETNIEIKIPIKIVREVSGITKNAAYTPGVFVGGSLALDGSRLLSFAPLDTNERDVTFSIKDSQLKNVRVENNTLIVAGNYALSDATKTIVVVAKSNKITDDMSAEMKASLTTEISVNVLKNIQAGDVNISTYIVNEKITNPLDMDEVVMLAKGKNTDGSASKYNAIDLLIDVSATDNPYVIGTDYVLEVVNSNKDIVTVTSMGNYNDSGKIFAHYRLETNVLDGISNITFSFRYKNINDIKIFSRTISVEVIDLPNTLLINGESEASQSFDIFTSYFHSEGSAVPDGKEIVTTVLPNNVPSTYQKVMLSIDRIKTVGNAIDITDEQLKFLLVVRTANSLEILPRVNSTIYDIPYGAPIYISINVAFQNILPLINSRIILNVYTYNALENFGGVEHTLTDADKINIQLTMHIKRGVTGIAGYLSKNTDNPNEKVISVAEERGEERVNVISSSEHAGASVRTIYTQFAPIGNADINENITVTSSDKKVLAFKSRNEILEKIDGKNFTRDGEFFTFDLVGLERGTAIVTINTGNGLAFDFRVYVRQPNDSLAFEPIDGTSEKNIGYLKQADVPLGNGGNARIYNDLAIKLGGYVGIKLANNVQDVSILSAYVDNRVVATVNNSVTGINISPLSVGSTVLTYEVSFFTADGVRRTQTFTTTINVYVPVEDFNLNTYAQTLFLGAGEHYLDKARFDLNVLFNRQNATRTITDSKGKVLDAYRIEMDMSNKNVFDWEKSVAVKLDEFGNIVMTGYDMQLYLSQTNALTGNYDIYFRVYEFGRDNYSKQEHCSISVRSAVAIATIELENVQVIENKNYINFDLRKGNLGKDDIIEAYNSNKPYVRKVTARAISSKVGEAPTFGEMQARIISSIDDAPFSALKIVQVGNEFYFAPTGNTGGTFTVRILALDSIQPLFPNGRVYQDILVTISDGVNTPFEISNAGELLAIGNNATTMSWKYVLRRDIDLTGTNMSPIGGNMPFTGSLSGALTNESTVDGNVVKTVLTTFAIRNVTFSASSTLNGNTYMGLFAINLGSLEHITLDNVKVVANVNFDSENSKFYYGAIAALNNNADNTKMGKILNPVVNYVNSNLGENSNIVYTTVSIPVANPNYELHIGGVAGKNGGQITGDKFRYTFGGVTSLVSAETFSTGSIAVHANLMGSDPTKIYIGGVVGSNYGTLMGNYISQYESDVATAFANGGSGENTTITSNLDIKYDETVANGAGAIDVVTNEVSVGGIIGLNANFVSNLSYSGTVNGVDNVGGIIGINTEEIADTTIDAVYLLNYGAKVEGRKNVGGITGKSTNAYYSVVGVQIMNMDDTEIDNSGAIVGNNNVGGIVGLDSKGVIEYGFVESFVKDIDTVVQKNVHHDIEFAGSYTTKRYMGGIIGSSSNSTIRLSYAKVNLVASIDDNVDLDYDNIGGLVGIGNLNINIDESYFRGNLIYVRSENISADIEATLPTAGIDVLVSEITDTYSIKNSYLESYLVSDGKFVAVIGVFPPNDYIDLSAVGVGSINATLSTVLGYDIAEAFVDGHNWIANEMYNDGVAIQVYNRKPFSQVVPNKLDVTVRAESDKRIVISKDSTERTLGYMVGEKADDSVLLFYHEGGSVENLLGQNTIAVDSVFDISFKPEAAMMDARIKVVNGSANLKVINSNSRYYFVLTGVGTAEIKIYSPFNNALQKSYRIYISHGIQDFNLFRTTNTDNNDNLFENNGKYTFKSNESTIFTPEINNGIYTVNSAVKLRPEAVTKDILRVNDNIVDGNAVYNAQSQMKVVAKDLTGIVVDNGKMTSDITFTPFIDMNSLFGLAGKDVVLKNLETKFNVAVSQTATKLTINYFAREMESGETAQMNVKIDTSYTQEYVVPHVKDSTGKILLFDKDTHQSNTDELKIVVTAGGTQAEKDYFKSFFGDVDASTIFDVYCEDITVENGVISYNNLTFELKEEYKSATNYLKENITLDMVLYADSDREISGTYSLTILPQSVDKINMAHYPHGEVTSVDGGTIINLGVGSGDIIVPGTSGLMKVAIGPVFANVDRFSITSSSVLIDNVASIVQFEQMVFSETLDTYITLYARPTPIEGGINLHKVSRMDVNGNLSYDGYIYVRTILNSLIASELQFNITFNAYQNDIETPIKQVNKLLLTTYAPSITVSAVNTEKISDGIRQYYMAEKGSRTTKVTIEVYGYEYKTPIVYIPNPSNEVSMPTIADRTDFIKTPTGSYLATYTIDVPNNLKAGFKFDVIAEISVSLNGVPKEDSKTINFVVIDALISNSSPSFIGVDSKRVVNISLGSATALKMSWTSMSGKDVTDDINKQLLSNLGVNGEDGWENYLQKFSYMVNNATGGQYYDPLQENAPLDRPYLVRANRQNSIMSGYSLVGQEIVSNASFRFVVYYGYVFNNGAPEIRFYNNANALADADGLYNTISYDFSLNVHHQIDEKLPVPIYDATQFRANLTTNPDQNYILMNNIVLEDWEPINANFLSLDGNNKIITIKRFVPASPDTNTTASIGLFNTIANGTLLKNITIDISELSDMNVTDYTSYKYGTLAVTNNGLITNCEVLSLKTGKNNAEKNQITITGKNGQTGQASMFVCTNNGNITNSRVGTQSFVQHTGTIDNLTQKTIYSQIIEFSAPGEIAGFTVGNNKNISSSYVLGTSISNTSTLPGNSLTAGFVVKNSGSIYYSYVKSRGTVTSSTPKLTTNKIEGKGNVAGFVSENAGLVADSYTNIAVNSISMHTAGYVTKNLASGRIERCYAASDIISDDMKHMPFTGSNELTNAVQDLSINGIVDCYYLMVASDKFFADQLGDKAAGLSALSMKMETSLNNFTFIQGNSADSVNAIWTFGTINNGLGESVGILPELTSPNIIATSLRFYTGNPSDEEDGTGYSYQYAEGFDLGGQNNPYIIRHATEFNSLFNNFLNGANTIKTFSKYIRQVADIDFSETGYEIATREKINFAGNYDGNGMAIRNISIIAETLAGKNSSIGLFSRIEKTIIDNISTPTPVFKNTNLYFSGVSGTSVTYVGGLAGVIDSAYILNLNLYGDNAYVNAQNFAGGLAGIIRGKSKVINVGTNLSASVGYHSNAVYVDSVLNATFPLVNEYYSKADFNRLKDLGKIDAKYKDYDTYMSSLSYAGGLAGVIDITSDQENITSVEVSEISVKSITINTGKTGDSGSNQVKVIADNVGGVTGYSGRTTYMSRAYYYINHVGNSTNNLQYLQGYYTVGPLVGVNYGIITLSQVSGVDYNGKEESIQESLDKRLAKYMLGKVADVDKGNYDSIRGSYFVGGLVGLNMGGRIENSFTKVSLFGADAKYVGGVAGGVMDGGFNGVYSTSTLPLPDDKSKYTGGLAGIVFDYFKPSFEDNAFENYRFVTKNYTELFGKNSNNEMKKSNVVLNKVVAVNNYDYMDIEQYSNYIEALNSESIENTYYGVNAGSLIGYSAIGPKQYLGSGMDTSDGNVAMPTESFAINNLVSKNGTILLDGPKWPQVAKSAKVQDDEGNVSDPIFTNMVSGFDIYKLIDLSNENIIYNKQTFDQLFSNWPMMYWSKNELKLYPTLTRFGYGNVIEIVTEDDFGKINQNPTATFIIKNDIVMTKEYLNCIISVNFKGQLIGDKGSGQAPTISNIMLSAKSATPSCLSFFHQSEGAKFENIIFNYSKFNYAEKTTYIGGLIAKDNGSVLSQISVIGASGIAGNGKGATVGGIVGYGENTSINSSISKINIDVRDASYVGGVIGHIEGNQSLEDGTKRTGNVSATTYEGNIKVGSSIDTNIGGIIGESKLIAMNGLSTLGTTSITYGSANSNMNVGGLVGSSSGDLINGCNNIAPKIRSTGQNYLNDKTITKLSATDCVGGVAGIMTGTTVEDCVVKKRVDETANISFEMAGDSVPKLNAWYAGGIAGTGISCTIVDTESYARIVSQIDELRVPEIVEMQVGGILGNAVNDYKITTSFANADINVAGNSKNIASVGGIVGRSSHSVDTEKETVRKGTISETASFGNIKVGNIKTARVGALIGKVEIGGASDDINTLVNKIAKANRDCVLLDAVQTGGNIIIGAVGDIACGGIVGEMQTGTIQHSIALTFFDTTQMNITGAESDLYVRPIIGKYTKKAGTDGKVYCSVTGAIYSSDFMMTLDKAPDDSIKIEKGAHNDYKLGTNLAASDLIEAEANTPEKRANAVKIGLDAKDKQDYVYYTVGNNTLPQGKVVWKMGYGLTNTLPYLASLQGILESNNIITKPGSLMSPMLVRKDTTQMPNSSGYIVLMDDITVKSGMSGDFGGKLIGAGHSITYSCSNTTINPFFNNILAGGAVSNLNLIISATEVKNEYNFSVDAEFGFYAKYNNGTLFSCGLNSTGTTTINNQNVTLFGGLVARNSGKIYYSYNMANINLYNSKPPTISSTIGGLVGLMEGIAELSNSYFTGSLQNKSQGTIISGGLVGNASSVNQKIKYCYSAGKVNGAADFGKVAENSTRVANNYVDFYADCNNAKHTSTGIVGTDFLQGLTTYTIEGTEGHKYTELLGSGWKNIVYSPADDKIKTTYNYGYPIADFGLKTYSAGTNQLIDKIIGTATGSGTEKDPLQINNLGVLDNARNMFKKSFITNYKLVDNVKVVSNISVGDTLLGDNTGDVLLSQKWEKKTTLGGSGTFDGNNKTITGLTGGALIDTVQGKVQNLIMNSTNNSKGGTIANTVSGTINTCQIYGETTTLGGITKTLTDDGTITGCTVGGNLTGNGGIANIMNSGSIIKCKITANITGSGVVGGVTGTMISGSITGCTVTATITNGTNAGGVAGSMSGGTISDNKINNKYKGSSYANLGGAVGSMSTGEVSGNDISSSSDGTVSATDTFGGLVGSLTGGEVKSNTLSSGAMSGVFKHAGGMVGNMDGGTVTDNTVLGLSIDNGYDKDYARTGGVVGYMGGGTLNGTSTATVKGVNYVGGYIGEYIGGTIPGALNIKVKVTGTNHVGGAFGKYSSKDTTTRSIIITANSSVTGAETGSYVGGIIGTMTAEFGNDRLTNNATVTGGSYVGGIAGSNAINIKTIERLEDGGILTCLLSNTGAISGKANVGGIFGESTGTITSNEKVAEKIDEKTDKVVIDEGTGKPVLEVKKIKEYTGSDGTPLATYGITQKGKVTGTKNVGGIVGNAAAKLYGIVNQGVISSVNGENVGGVAGSYTNTKLDSSEPLVLFNMSNVLGKSNVGGLVGTTVNKQFIFDESGVEYYQVGNVEGVSNVGGLFGKLSNSNIDVKGISGNIEYKYNTIKGTVTGSQNVGGVIGNASDAKVHGVLAEVNVMPKNPPITTFGSERADAEPEALEVKNLGGIIGSATNSTIGRTRYYPIFVGSVGENKITTTTTVDGVTTSTTTSLYAKNVGGIIGYAENCNANGVVGKLTIKESPIDPNIVTNVMGSENVGGVIGYSDRSNVLKGTVGEVVGGGVGPAKVSQMVADAGTTGSYTTNGGLVGYMDVSTSTGLGTFTVTGNYKVTNSFNTAINNTVGTMRDVFTVEKSKVNNWNGGGFSTQYINDHKLTITHNGDFTNAYTDGKDTLIPYSRFYKLGGEIGDKDKLIYSYSTHAKHKSTSYDSGVDSGAGTQGSFLVEDLKEWTYQERVSRSDVTVRIKNPDYPDKPGAPEFLPNESRTNYTSTAIKTSGGLYSNKADNGAYNDGKNGHSSLWKTGDIAGDRNDRFMGVAEIMTYYEYLEKDNVIESILGSLAILSTYSIRQGWQAEAVYNQNAGLVSEYQMREWLLANINLM